MGVGRQRFLLYKSPRDTFTLFVYSYVLQTECLAMRVAPTRFSSLLSLRHSCHCCGELIAIMYASLKGVAVN